MAQDSLQGSLPLLVLKILARRGPLHGYGIATCIEGMSDEILKVEEGSLYPALHRLERDKLIQGEWKVTPNARRARFYRLTAAGRKRLADAEQNWSMLAAGVAKVLRFA
jgi:PadR family transcriptional regulator